MFDNGHIVDTLIILPGSGEGGAVLAHDYRCGSPFCRRTITGSDWQLPEVQQRQYLHFSPFINVHIDQQQG
jgi:hypothetical protein